MSQYPPDPNQPPPPPDPGGQWGAPPPQPPGPPPDPYGAPPGPPPDPYGAPPGAPVGAPPGAPSGPGWGQQPPSGPGWGAGTPPPMGPAKKKTNPVIPILIVVALIAVGVGAFVLLSGDDDKGGDSPESTVEAFFDAGQDRDCQAAGELLSSQAFEAFGGQEAALQACEQSLDQEGGLFSGEGAELTSTEVTSEDDSTATVTAEVRTAEGETRSQDISLVKEDGEWKISSFGGGGTTPPESGDDGSDGSDSGGTTPTSTPETTPPTDGGSGGSGGALPPAGPIPSDDPTATPEDLSNAEGCASGDMAACDSLYAFTDFGSELELYGRTCGGRVGDETRTGGECESEFG